MNFFLLFIFLTNLVCAIDAQNKRPWTRKSLTVKVKRIDSDGRNVAPRKSVGDKKLKGSYAEGLPILLIYPKAGQCLLHTQDNKTSPLTVDCQNHGIIGDHYFAVEDLGCFILRQNGRKLVTANKCDTPIYKAGYYYNLKKKKCRPQWKKQSSAGPNRKQCEKGHQTDKLILTREGEKCILLSSPNYKLRETKACDGSDIHQAYYHRIDGQKCRYVDADKKSWTLDPQACDDKYYKARFVSINSTCLPVWKWNDGPSNFANGFKTREECRNDKVSLITLRLCDDVSKQIKIVAEGPCPEKYALCQDLPREYANAKAKGFEYESLSKNHTHLSCIMRRDNPKAINCTNGNENLNVICPVSLKNDFVKKILRYVATLNDCLDPNKKHYIEVTSNDCKTYFANCASVNEQERLIKYDDISRGHMFNCQKEPCISEPKYDTFCLKSDTKQFLEKMYPSSNVAFYDFCDKNDLSIAKIVDECRVGMNCRVHPYQQVKEIVNFHIYERVAKSQNSSLTPLNCMEQRNCKVVNESNYAKITSYCFGERMEYLTGVNLAKYHVCDSNSKDVRYKEVKSCGHYIHCKRYTRKQAQQILTRNNTNFDGMKYAYCHDMDCNEVGIYEDNANAVCPD